MSIIWPRTVWTTLRGALLAWANRHSAAIWFLVVIGEMLAVGWLLACASTARGDQPSTGAYLLPGGNLPGSTPDAVDANTWSWQTTAESLEHLPESSEDPWSLDTANSVDLSPSPAEGLSPGGSLSAVDGRSPSEPWTWQVMPAGLIYRSYLAGSWEPRLRSEWNYLQDHGWVWDLTLGGRQGLIRYGTEGQFQPEGWQLDLEGAAITRIDFENQRDVWATDYRAGVPLTYGRGRHATKLAGYHLSSHLGDEFVQKNPGFPRINYARNVLVWGQSYFASPDLRLYGETGWAFTADGGSKPWEFQFGADFAPARPTGSRGAPFMAFNGHLRQELNFSGNLVAQAGWMWRGAVAGRLLRMGLNYYNGKSRQLSLFQYFEQQLGMGIWCDF